MPCVYNIGVCMTFLWTLGVIEFKSTSNVLATQILSDLSEKLFSFQYFLIKIFTFIVHIFRPYQTFVYLWGSIALFMKQRFIIQIHLGFKTLQFPYSTREGGSRYRHSACFFSITVFRLWKTNFMLKPPDFSYINNTQIFH